MHPILQVWGDLVNHARDAGCLVGSGSVPELRQAEKECKLAIKRLGLITKPGNELFKGAIWSVSVCPEEVCLLLK